MTETLGSGAKVRWDKPKDRLNRARTEADLRAILVMVAEVRHAFDDAVEGGAYQAKGETNVRGKGFEESDPTHSAATNPIRRDLRGTAIHAAYLIAEARQRLEDAGWTLSNGLLRSDPEEWIHAQEKRRAATQG